MCGFSYFRGFAQWPVCAFFYPAPGIKLGFTSPDIKEVEQESQTTILAKNHITLKYPDGIGALTWVFDGGSGIMLIQVELRNIVQNCL
jgi:hypothetical protein